LARQPADPSIGIQLAYRLARIDRLQTLLARARHDAQLLMLDL
jgi:hypothetical protein